MLRIKHKYLLRTAAAFLLLLFFYLQGVAAQGSYFGYMSVDKLSDSTLGFYGEINGNVWQTTNNSPPNPQIDSIFFVDEASGLVFADKITATQNIYSSSHTQITAYYILNLNNPAFASLKSKDSLMVKFNIRAEAYIYGIGYYREGSGFYATAGLVSLLSKVYLSNYFKISSSQGPRSHFNHAVDHKRVIESIYHTPMVTEADFDTLSFSNVAPFCSKYFGLFGGSYGAYKSPYSETNPMDGIFCSFFTSPPCTPKPNEYPPKGFYFDPKTGQYIIGINKPNNSNPLFWLTTLMEEGRMVKGTYLPLQKSYITTVHWYTSSGGNALANGKSSRMQAPAYEWHVCAGDTLRFAVDNRPAETSVNQGIGILKWDSGIATASFTTSQLTYITQQGIFTWAPDSNDIHDQPHRFSVSSQTESPINGWHPIPNNRSFLVYVHPKIHSKLVVDSVRCGAVSCHAVDTLDVPLNFQYNWQLTDLTEADTLDLQSGKVASLQAPDSGWYVVHMRVSAVDGRCPFKTKDTVYVSSFLHLHLADTTFCQYDSVHLLPNVSQDSGTVTYTWHTATDTLTTPFLVLLQADKDTAAFLHIQDERGCQASDSAAISWLYLPVFTLGNDLVICPADSATLSSPSIAKSLLWSNGQSTPTIQADSGLWSLLIADSNGCENRDSIIISYQVHPTLASELISTACTNSDILLQIAQKNRWTAPEWQYNTISYSQDTLKLATTANVAIVKLAAIFDTLGLGCTYQTQDTITVFDPPILSINALDTLCNTVIPQVIGVFISGGSSLVWDNGKDTFAEEITAVQGKRFYGPFSKWARATSTQGCKSTDTITVWVELQDSLSLSTPDSICSFVSAPLALTATSTYDLKRAWMVNNTLNPSTLYNITAADSLAASLTISLASTEALHCSNAQVSKTVTLIPQPIAGFTLQPSNGCIPLRVSGDALYTDYQVYKWYINNQLTYTYASWVTDYTTPRQLDVQLIVSQAMCSDTSSVQKINAYPKPEITVQVSESRVFIDKPEVLHTANGNTGDQFAWYDSTGTLLSTAAVFSYTANDTGVFKIMLHTVNQFGCETWDSISFNVLPKIIVSIPTAFSPNGDGINDSFGPVSYGIASYSMVIYNRWGEKVYEGNEKWNGENAIPGYYLYQMELHTSSGQRQLANGYVYLLR